MHAMCLELIAQHAGVVFYRIHHISQTLIILVVEARLRAAVPRNPTTPTFISMLDVGCGSGYVTGTFEVSDFNFMQIMHVCSRCCAPARF
jgi:hypothetical protein